MLTNLIAKKKLRLCVIFCLIVLLSMSYVFVNAKCRLIIRNNTIIRMKEGIFQKSDEITKITIPYGVTGIGEKAFINHEYLEYVEIPGSVKQIGRNAFYACIKLEKVDMSYGVESIGKLAFTHCFSLKEIDLPDSILTIDDGAFSVSGLREIDIPQYVERIGEGAFAESFSLEKVTIPKSVISLGTDAFVQTSWQDSLGVEEGYCIYSNDILLDTWLNGGGLDEDEINSIVDFILEKKILNKGETESKATYKLDVGIEPMVIYTRIKVKDGTRLLADGALSCCWFLNELELPSSLEIIGDEAFSECLSLQEIIIPENVKIIGKDVFSGCRNLRTIKIPKHLKDSFIYTGNAEVIYY